MVVNRVANNRSTFQSSTRGDREVVLTRLFEAPRHLVIEAMSRPEHVRRWWGNLGEGYSVPVCEIDFRVGGRWRFVNHGPMGEAGFHGEYLEIEVPDRIVMTEIFDPFPDHPSIVSTTFSDEGGKTRMTVSCMYPSAEVRDMVLGTGMLGGAATSYDRLDEVALELHLER